MVTDETLPLELSTNSALSLGLIYLGQGNEEVINSIITAMLGFSENTLNQPLSIFLPVALSLLFIGKQTQIDTILEAV